LAESTDTELLEGEHGLLPNNAMNCKSWRMRREPSLVRRQKRRGRLGSHPNDDEANDEGWQKLDQGDSGYEMIIEKDVDTDGKGGVTTASTVGIVQATFRP
jgi:hypothetical protein